MHLKSVFTLVTALLAAAVVHADNFEGKVSMTVSNDKGKQPQTISYEIKGQIMRVDLASQANGRMGAAIIDLGKQQMTILMPQQHMYMVRPFGAANGHPQGGNQDAAAPSGADRAQLVPTVEKTTLLGYPCTKYTITDNGATTQMWVTDALGTFWGFGGMASANRGRGGMPGGSAPSAWEQALSGKGFFPLKIAGTDAQGHSYSMEVNSISKTPVPDSEFQAPSDYREFNLGAMMGGFGR